MQISPIEDPNDELAVATAKGELITRTELLLRKLNVNTALEGSRYVMEVNGIDVVFSSQLSSLSLYCKRETRAALISALEFTLAQILVPRKLQGFQVTVVVADILEAYPVLKLEEILYVFREAMRGSWNPEGYFGCVDAPTVHNWIKSYIALVRDPLVERNVERQHEFNKGKGIEPMSREKVAQEYERRQLGLNHEEYLLYLELLKPHAADFDRIKAVMSDGEAMPEAKARAVTEGRNIKLSVSRQAAGLHAAGQSAQAAQERALLMEPRIAKAQASLPDLNEEELKTYADAYLKRKEPELAGVFSDELKRRQALK